MVEVSAGPRPRQGRPLSVPSSLWIEDFREPGAVIGGRRAGRVQAQPSELGGSHSSGPACRSQGSWRFLFICCWVTATPMAALESRHSFVLLMHLGVLRHSQAILTRGLMWLQADGAGPGHLQRSLCWPEGTQTARLEQRGCPGPSTCGLGQPAHLPRSTHLSSLASPSPAPSLLLCPPRVPLQSPQEPGTHRATVLRQTRQKPSHLINLASGGGWLTSPIFYPLEVSHQAGP